MNDTAHSATMRSVALMLGLAGIIAVHVMDLPGKMEEVPYVGFMYLGIILAAGFLIHRILAGATRRDFLAAAGLAGAVLVGYVVNRTMGMPGATDDIGNWWEPLGFLSIVIEAWVVVVGLTAARAFTRLPRAATPMPEAVGVSSF
ncbi:MAG: twin-arginine translocation signal domain-containing protein [bacterium]|nr:twin-arginine translocation signal domain-containing protein [bacterium]